MEPSNAVADPQWVMADQRYRALVLDTTPILLFARSRALFRVSYIDTPPHETPKILWQTLHSVLRPMTNPDQDYRLPKDVTPIHYDLKVWTDLVELKFEGVVEVV